MRENRDYYNQTNSFDGSVGIGVGKLAERAATCKPGVANWATDQGEWNSIHHDACAEPHPSETHRDELAGVEGAFIG